ncbi:hypothetical protein [uncultured Microscilla sp.]|nr:hypothetical protein [uncultured Microscilla sp.]
MKGENNPKAFGEAISTPVEGFSAVLLNFKVKFYYFGIDDLKK